MAVYEFQLVEHNFQNHPGTRMPDMDALSVAGWWVESTVIAFPFAYVLWKRPTDAAPEAPAEADHTACTSVQAAIAQERDAALVAAQQNAADKDTLARERDQARDVARQLKADNDNLARQNEQLRTKPGPPPSQE